VWTRDGVVISVTKCGPTFPLSGFPERGTGGEASCFRFCEVERVPQVLQLAIEIESGGPPARDAEGPQEVELLRRGRAAQRRIGEKRGPAGLGIRSLELDELESHQ